MGNIVSIEQWLKNHPEFIEENVEFNLYEKIEDIEMECCGDLLPLSPKIKRGILKKSIFEIKTYNQYKIERRIRINENNLYAIKYAILAFEQQMKDLVIYYPEESFDSTLFRKNWYEKEKIILNRIRDIITYLYERSRKLNTECIFEVGSKHKLIDGTSSNFDNELIEWQNEFLLTFVNYSILSHLKSGVLTDFDKLILIKK